MKPNSPAGWYPDPMNPAQLRYWNGAYWTEQTAAAPPPGEPATPAPAGGADKKPNTTAIGCLGVIVLAVLAGIAIALIPTTEPAHDAAARNACTHWWNVRADMFAGILTDDEIRTKVREVYDSASLSDERAVRDNARTLLAAATSRDLVTFQESVDALTEACRPVIAAINE